MSQGSGRALGVKAIGGIKGVQGRKLGPFPTGDGIAFTGQGADEAASSQACSPKGQDLCFHYSLKIRTAELPELLWSCSRSRRFLLAASSCQRCQHYLSIFSFLSDCLMRSVSCCCCPRANRSPEELYSIYSESETTRSQTGRERTSQVVAGAAAGWAQKRVAPVTASLRGV